MRHVDKDLTRTPSRLNNPKAVKSLQAILADGNADKVSGDIYMGIYSLQGERRSEVREFLNEIYFDKCAYCELLNHPEVEHYRPKGRVTEAPDHGGYYWLCYEYSNLLPACHDCNAVNGKLNQFPVGGTRVLQPVLLLAGNLDPAHSAASGGFLLAEQPLLLHPEIDHPQNFLAFEWAVDGVGIYIKGIDGEQGRGEVTIRICDLNRKYLRLSRDLEIAGFIKNLNNGLKLVANDTLEASSLPRYYELIFSQAQEDAQNPRRMHSLLRTFILQNEQNFAAIILPRIAENGRELVREAFRAFVEARF